MGPDQSKQAPAPAAAPREAQTAAPAPPQASALIVAPPPPTAPAEEFEGIPLIPPLISRRQQSEQYPPDISIPSGNLPSANKLAKSYFAQVATTINRNQDQLAAGIKSQLEDYARMATILEGRRNELDGRLAKMLSQFRAFDAEVKATVDLLNAEIEKAEKLAEEIDPSIPKFAAFPSR